MCPGGNQGLGPEPAAPALPGVQGRPRGGPGERHPPTAADRGQGEGKKGPPPPPEPTSDNDEDNDLEAGPEADDDAEESEGDTEEPDDFIPK